MFASKSKLLHVCSLKFTYLSALDATNTCTCETNRNTGRTEVRILETERKIHVMANFEFQQNKNDRSRKYKITTEQSFSTNMRSVFRIFKQG
jgi:hypothetical protein